MRKWISIVLTTAMLMGMMSVGGFMLPTSAYPLGDVNLNGSVTTYDARALLTMLVSGSSLSAEQQQTADVNGDGAINTSDIKLILGIVMNGNIGTVTSNVNLMAADMDLWNNPVQLVNQTHCTVKQQQAAQGVSFVNVTETDLQPGNNGNNPYANPYTWPYTAFSYDQRLLLPRSATIAFDLTVASSATSIQLYLGGYRPHVDDNKNPLCISLNRFITSNLDHGSGDMLAGTYSGTISVGTVIDSILRTDDCLVDGKLWVSGIKIFVVGYNDTAVTVRTLKVSQAYVGDVDVPMSSDPYEAVRPYYNLSEETGGLTALTAMELYKNGERRATTNEFDYSADNKKIYHTLNNKRVLNYADGYKIEIPTDWEPDYSLSALRSRYESEDYVLTVSKEEENPYSDWETYRDEWLIKYIGNESFLSENHIRYTRDPIESTTWLSGYTVMTYDMAIDWQGKIDMPYYSIAVIREYYVYDTFYLMVLKSSVPTEGMMDRLIRSFEECYTCGTPVNSQGQYDRRIPTNWSDETKAYYEKLCNQNSTDWGFFSYSMVEPADDNYTGRYNDIISEKDRIESAIGYEYDILPTYTHLGWGNYKIPFPLEMAQELAGGNGYNGKPVLQFTYQYTTTNNSNLTGSTPIFNVLRGDYDMHFRQLARDIKTYGKPVLFRLNNEMNTDWTSYCGLVSLLDPDIFVMGWQYLYDIFEEEGVDNCIWIFNPFTPTTPYSSWGETLCYMPGAEYVQILGLTNYEMGNSSSVASFYSEYTEVYENSNAYFNNMPWVISEFACGAGGEKQYDYTYDYCKTTTPARNSYYQTNYINNMFYYLNYRNSYPFCKNIKAAIWFNCNDYVNLDGTDYIVNYLELTPSALNAFKSGLAGQ